MSDLDDLLRDARDYVASNGNILVRDLADELERLQRDHNEARTAAAQWQQAAMNAMDRAERAEADREQLRAALETARARFEAMPITEVSGFAQSKWQAAALARKLGVKIVDEALAALAKEEKPNDA